MLHFHYLKQEALQGVIVTKWRVALGKLPFPVVAWWPCHDKKCVNN